jgi:hypothetical protein
MRPARPESRSENGLDVLVEIQSLTRRFPSSSVAQGNVKSVSDAPWA